MDLIDSLIDGHDFGQPERGEAAVLVRSLNGQRKTGKSKVKNLTGDPVVKALSFHCWWHRFHLWLEN